MTAQTSLPETRQFLMQFDCLHGETISPEQRDRIRQALLTVAQHSDYQIFGVCADSLDQGKAALQQYTNALGYAPELNFPPIEGSVYLKFNPKSGLCYADSYTGEHRGVLVSYQSADEDGVNEMFGHLPLDLFAG